MLISKDLSLIENLIKQAKVKYPKLFDESIDKSFLQMVVNQNKHFFTNRCKKHLIKILLAQFFLQKKIRKNQLRRKVTYSKLFKSDSRICAAVILSFDRKCEIFNEVDLFKILKSNISGAVELKESFYTFQSIKSAYLFCYLEIQKMRGCDLGNIEIKRLEKVVEKQLSNEIKSFCPTIFWPYNYEETYRQLNALTKEVVNEQDLPQLSVSFKGQTAKFLEFIFHMAYPIQKDILKKLTNLLPPYLLFSLHTNFTSESYSAVAFSLHYPIEKVDQPINLLSVRNALTILVEDIIGPYRDFNGGLFIKQADVFEKIKLKLNHISDFNFFSKKLFYSLKPIETQLTLSLKAAKLLFSSFSKVLQNTKELVYLQEREVLIVKSSDDFVIKRLLDIIKEDVCYASIELNNAFYLAIIDPSKKYIQKIINNPIEKNSYSKILRLAFNEGEPPSLNPCYAYSDIRCCTIYRALFEGLTRAANDKIHLSGAKSYQLKDENTYHFKLQPNRWSNGEKVTAYQYERRWKENIASAKEFLVNEFTSLKNGKEIIEGKISKEKLGVKALNEDTLELKLAFKDQYLLEKLSLPLFYPSYDESKEPTIFNGPFMIEKYNSKLLKLEKNPYFWDKKNIKLDYINIKFINDAKKIYELFKAGEIDWIGAPLAYIPVNIEKLLKKQKILQERDVLHTFWLHLNSRYFHLNSKYIRKALSLSINRKKIYKTVHLEACLKYPFSKAANLENIDFNPNMAKRYFKLGLDELGIDLKGFPIVELSYFSHPKMKELASYLKRTWKNILGIKIKVIKSEWNEFRNSLEKGKFQVGGCFEISNFFSFCNLLQRFKYIDFICLNESKNKLFFESLSIYQKNQNKNFLIKALDLFVEDLPSIPLFDGIQKYSLTSTLKEFVFDKTGGVDFSRAYFK